MALALLCLLPRRSFSCAVTRPVSAAPPAAAVLRCEAHFERFNRGGGGGAILENGKN